MRSSAKILDIAGYLPDKVLTNEELARLYPEWSAEKIYKKTGIRERHIATKEQTAGDLAFEAAKALFAKGNIKPDQVDFIILCTQAADYILPTTACLLQARLSVPHNAGAIDINVGCSGFVYGLSLAKGLIETGAAKCILLLTADTYSKYIHPLDKSVRTLFGDGAAATAIIASDEGHMESIGPFIFGTDGSGGGDLIVEAGGFRKPKDEYTAIEKTDSYGNVRSAENLYMDGAEVMAFSLREVPIAVNLLLEKANRSREDVDYFVLHQANKFMLEALQKKLKIPEEKLPILMADSGNTVSSTIPLALIKMQENDKFHGGRRLMLIGFGVGYSWAACFLNI
jgi:3-oxoacyl-[acyl-carrier-protein] synthase-3